MVSVYVCACVDDDVCVYRNVCSGIAVITIITTYVWWRNSVNISRSRKKALLFEKYKIVHALIWSDEGIKFQSNH